MTASRIGLPEIRPETTLAEVYELYPSTGTVFADHGFDLCCGGGRTLAFAAEAHGVDLESLLAELREAVTGSPAG